VARRRAFGLAALAGGIAAGAAVGWLAERRAVRRLEPANDPDWEELVAGIDGKPFEVTSFDGTVIRGDLINPDSAPTVVLVHGFTMSKEFWHYQRRDLPYRVVSYDQRGHGASDSARDGDWSVQALGKDLRAVLDTTLPEGQRAVVVGHSMGGMATMALAEVCSAAEVTDRVAGVVLANTTGSDAIAGSAAGASLAALGAVRDRVYERGMSLVQSRPELYDRVYGASTDLSHLLFRSFGLTRQASPAHVAFSERLVLGCPSKVVASFGPLITHLDLRDAARDLRVPALVIAAAHDRLTPMRQSRRLAELLDDAEFVVLDDVGHMAPLEDHERFTRLVCDFAQRVLQ
jgi:pimeloyl-ACP methyl ester carboxylesterase